MLRRATRGGAAVLGRPEIGSIEVGKAADLIAFDLNRLSLAGALHDPVAALVLCGVPSVDQSWVHGRRIVEDGNLVTVDLPALVEQHDQAASRLARG